MRKPLITIIFSFLSLSAHADDICDRDAASNQAQSNTALVELYTTMNSHIFFLDQADQTLVREATKIVGKNLERGLKAEQVLLNACIGKK